MPRTKASANSDQKERLLIKDTKYSIFPAFKYLLRVSAEEKLELSTNQNSKINYPVSKKTLKKTLKNSFIDFFAKPGK